MKNKKQKHTLKKLSLKALILVIVILNVSALINVIEARTNQFAYWLMSPFNYESVMLTVSKPKAVEAKEIYTVNMSVQDKIRFYAGIYGVDVETALRIAKCESNFNPKAENINGSATGVYQFVRKTWKTYCGGDVYNADQNIVCFMQLYPEHPEFWECK